MLAECRTNPHLIKRVTPVFDLPAWRSKGTRAWVSLIFLCTEWSTLISWNLYMPLPLGTFWRVLLYYVSGSCTERIYYRL